jgi:hypothetical protein
MLYPCKLKFLATMFFAKCTGLKEYWFFMDFVSPNQQHHVFLKSLMMKIMSLNTLQRNESRKMQTVEICLLVTEVYTFLL